MVDLLRNICVIPARSGSKGIPDKNIQKINGQTLLQNIYDRALESSLFDEIIISTDSDNYLSNLKTLDGLTSKIRPAYLSTDTASVFDVIKYEVSTLSLNKDDNIIILQPTSPFTNKDYISNAVQMLTSSDCDTVISAVKVEANHPSYMFRSKQGYVDWYEKSVVSKISRRQDLEPLYKRVGNIYGFKYKMLSEKTIYAGRTGFIEIEEAHSITIDTMFDLEYARYLSERN